MRVAVLGAGMAGLTAARRLALEGADVDVYERWPGLGGQVATFDIGGGHLIERYYHALMTTDVEIAGLYDELGMGDAIEWKPSRVAVLVDGRVYSFTTPVDLLRFKPMSLRARFRMGIAFLRLDRDESALPRFEHETAKAWVLREMGAEAWEKVWGPLLRGKFGDVGNEISMAWLWKKLVLRRPVKGKQVGSEVLGYPRGSWQPLLERLARDISSQGGRVLIDQPAARIDLDGDGFLVSSGAPDSFRRGHDPAGFTLHGEPERYDSVLSTVPNDIFLRLLSEETRAALGDPYRAKLESVRYHTAVCLVLVLRQPLTEFFWMNIADSESPFVGLIEKTNLVDPDRLGGRHVLYVANYVSDDDPLTALDADALLDLYEPFLRKVNPEFDRSWIESRWLFREPAAQPVVTVGYHSRIPSMETPVPGLFFANTTQIYPEDRGTNYSVRLGESVAETITRSSSAEDSAVP